MLELKSRHDKLRKDVKKQAHAIINAQREERAYLSNGLTTFPQILGIDAASSEIACRPEVFAQVFRYARRCIPDFGFTFHVGEDFYDIVDGLRAINECINFLNLKPFDRLGHALALGVDVATYYSNRRNVISMPKHVALDNMMWLYMQLSRCAKYRKLQKELHTRFQQLFIDIYADSVNCPSIETFYMAWLLRGDNPQLYSIKGYKEMEDDVDVEWHAERMLRTAEADNARKNKEAQILYFHYHYNRGVKIKGIETITIKYPQSLINAIRNVQKWMLNKVESMHLSIECNPTSNFKIGDIDWYDEHPIRRFYSKHLNNNTEARKISVSINTDDKGVFATSLEREYALIAESFIRYYGGSSKAEAKVMKWLDEIRKNSLKQKFIQ